jgi:hypothetical protein
VFYEIENEDVPPGYVLVTAADATTYFLIVEARALYHVVHRDAISSGDTSLPVDSTILPETGWKDLKFPVILVPDNSLE